MVFTLEATSFISLIVAFFQATPMSWFGWQALTLLWLSRKAAHNMLPKMSLEVLGCSSGQSCVLCWFPLRNTNSLNPNQKVLKRKPTSLANVKASYDKCFIPTNCWKRFCICSGFSLLFASLLWASASACTCGKWAPPASWIHLPTGVFTRTSVLALHLQ